MFSIFTYVMSRVTRSEPGLPMLERATMTRGSWKTTVPCKFPTVLGQVLTVVFQLRRSLLSLCTYQCYARGGGDHGIGWGL